MPSFASARTALAIGLLTMRGAAQIRVLTPSWLAEALPDSRGRIKGATATFGAPFYGDRVLGRLAWGESRTNHSHCLETDYDVPDLPAAGGAESGFEDAKLIKIVIVHRGKCSFTKKVQVAYKKGAHAVIIVDQEDSNYTSGDLQRIIVTDDGFGEKIHIPSILITSAEGRRLIDATKQSEVIVDLDWEVPKDTVVSVDLWMSSGSEESMKFLKEFAAYRRALNAVVRFQPHYVVFGMPSSDPGVYNELCSDSTGRHCTEDPDGSGDITGKDVLTEDVRQLCIHELTKVPRTSAKDLKRGKPLVEYAGPYWDYVSQILDRCPLGAKNPQDRFGDECSARLMAMVGVDKAAVDKCVSETKDQKLQHERESSAWSPKAVRINGWRYSGVLDADLVTRAICAGFTSLPPECDTLLTRRDPTEEYLRSRTAAPAQGLRISTLVAAFALTAVLALGALLHFKRRLKRNMRSALQEEVMLEVQMQMGEYRDLASPQRQCV